MRGFSTEKLGIDLCLELVTRLAECFGCDTVDFNKTKLAERWQTLSQHLVKQRKRDLEDDDDDWSYGDEGEDMAELKPRGGSDASKQNNNLFGDDDEVLDEGVNRVCVVIHNIDGIALRTDEIQNFLCELASTPEIQLIASMDDVRGANSWSKEALERFHWWWIQVHTFTGYDVESSSWKRRETEGAITTAASQIERTVKVLQTLNKKASVTLGCLCDAIIKQLQASKRKKNIWIGSAEWMSLEGMESLRQRDMEFFVKTFLENNVIVKQPGEKLSYSIKLPSLEHYKDLKTKIEHVQNEKDVKK